MAGMFSDTFSPSASDSAATSAAEPTDPMSPDPVVYDNPDTPDDRGPGEPAPDYTAGSQMGGDDFGDGGM